MTGTRILYGVEALHGELSDEMFQKLNMLDLIAPCCGCTDYVNEPETVVYHPNASTRSEAEVEAEITALAAKPN